MFVFFFENCSVNACWLVIELNWCVDGLAQFAADCSNPGSSAAAAFAVSNPLNCLFLSLKAIRICYSVF